MEMVWLSHTDGVAHGESVDHGDDVAWLFNLATVYDILRYLLVL